MSYKEISPNTIVATPSRAANQAKSKMGPQTVYFLIYSILEAFSNFSEHSQIPKLRDKMVFF